MSDLPVISLFNTLTRRVEPVTPLVPGEIKVYNCGPTIYDYVHIGNLRTFLFQNVYSREERLIDTFEKALAHSRKIALDPWVWCEYADVLGMAQGTLAGKPTEAITKALELQHDHPKALEMAGSAAYERRDFAAAAHYWQRLLPQLAEGSPPQQAVSAAIARAERQAAVALPNSR